MRLLLCLIIAATSPFALAAEPEAASNELRAGYAERDITPQENLPLWRYHGTPPNMPAATGTRDPLMAKVIVFASGVHRIAVISVDLGRPPEEALIQRLIDQTDLNYLLISATHTQNGPVVDARYEEEPEDEQGKSLKRYAEQLENRLMQAINEALGQLQPVNIAWRATRLKGIVQLEEPGGRRPEDDTCMVVKIEQLDKTPLVSWVNFGCHPDTCPETDLAYSADFPGVLTAKIQAATGAPSLFLQSAAYRQYAAPPKDDVSPENVTAAVGHEFAQQLIPDIEALKPEPARTQGLSYVASRLRYPSRPNLGNPSVLIELANQMGPERTASYVSRYGANRITPSVTMCLINDQLLLVGLSGEFSIQTARELREHNSTLDVCVLGFCNGYDNVFPAPNEVLPEPLALPVHQAWAPSTAASHVVYHVREHLLPNLERLSPQVVLKKGTGP